MALNIISHLLVFIAGLSLDSNTMLEYFLSPQGITVPRPPVAIIAATKTIKLPADTITPSLEGGVSSESAFKHSSALYFFLLFLASLLLSICHLQYLRQKAAASQAAAIEQSVRQELELHITALTRALQAAQSQSQANSDDAKELRKQLKERLSALKKIEQQHHEWEEQIGDICQRLEHTTTAFSDAKSQICNLEEQVTACNDSLRSKDTELATRDRVIDALNEKLTLLSTQLSDREQQLVATGETPPTEEVPVAGDESGSEGADDDDAEEKSNANTAGNGKKRRRKRGKGGEKKAALKRVREMDAEVAKAAQDL